MERQSYIYIPTNFGKTTLYIGVTNDLARRIYEHREKIFPGFTPTTKLKFYDASLRTIVKQTT